MIVKPQAIMLLCDYAEEVNGKLYIAGGGWNRFPQNQVRTMSIAVKLEIPWDQANRKFTVRLRLETSDGEDVPQLSEQMKVEGQLELGRPAGVKPGSTLVAPFAFTIPGVQYQPGEYAWIFTVDSDEVARASFVVS